MPHPHSYILLLHSFFCHCTIFIFLLLQFCHLFLSPFPLSNAFLFLSLFLVTRTSPFFSLPYNSFNIISSPIFLLFLLLQISVFFLNFLNFFFFSLTVFFTFFLASPSSSAPNNFSFHLLSSIFLFCSK